MPPVKIAVLSVSEESAWCSNRLISRALREAYTAKKTGAITEEYRLDTFHSYLELNELADRIVASDPDIVVFLDTLSPYGTVLRRLAARFSASEKKPVLRFHIYGDFTSRAYLWKYWADDLKAFRIEFACASEKQRRLVEASLKTPTDATWLCPFPVLSRHFLFNSKRRLKARKLLYVKSDERIILYTGRISLQKNIPALIHAFGTLANLRDDLRLFIAGEYDDIGSPINDFAVTQGLLYKFIQDEIDTLPERVRQKITIYRGIGGQALHSMYDAADIYFSASLQHDEDFGMAPAEAAIHGLPLVLTDWGGYSSYREMGAHGHWIPVKLANGANFDLRDAVAALERAVSEKPGLSRRRADGAKIAGHLSVSAISKRISRRGSQVPPRFTGFTDVVNEMAAMYNPSKGYLVINSFGEGSVYEQVYKNYI